jgi:hypothetical protein
MTIARSLILHLVSIVFYFICSKWEFNDFKIRFFGVNSLWQMETTSQHMDETDTNVRRTQSDLGGEAVIAAALRSTQTWNQASAIPEAAAKNRSRKLTRHLAKTHLRRSASQPVVILPAGAGRIRPDGPSDEDAGLCLSEDDNLSDCGNIPQVSQSNGTKCVCHQT